MKKIFILLLILSAPLHIAFGCGRIAKYEITKYDEKGHFEYKFNDNVASISIDNKLHPGTEIYINNSLLSPYIYKDESTYYLAEEYSSEYFPSKVNISILQNRNEIYSAKWKIKDVSFSLPEKLSPFLLAISLFITAASFTLVLIGIFIKKFNFAIKILIASIIADLIFLFFYFSAHC